KREVARRAPSPQLLAYGGGGSLSGVGEGAAALGRDVARAQLFAAVRADQHRVRLMAAEVVAQHHGRAELALQVLVAPAHQRDDRRIEVAPGLREPVLVALGLLL